MNGLKTREMCLGEATSGKHWSEIFYEDAKAKGYKFAARAYYPTFCEGFETDAGLQAFNEEKDLYELPFVAKRKSSNLDRFELEPYAPDGEHILMAYMKDGARRVVAYWMKLT